jgi:hypothetical protein
VGEIIKISDPKPTQAELSRQREIEMNNRIPIHEFTIEVHDSDHDGPNYSIRSGERFQNWLCLDEVIGRIAIILAGEHSPESAGLRTIDERYPKKS